MMKAFALFLLLIVLGGIAVGCFIVYIAEKVCEEEDS